MVQTVSNAPWNQAKEWSTELTRSGWTWTVPTDPIVGMKNLFNSITTDNDEGVVGGTSNITTLSGFGIPGNKLTLYISGDPANLGTITINDGSPQTIVNPGPANGALGTQDFTIPGGYLDSIEITTSALYGIAVDDLLLVDRSVIDPNAIETKIVSIDESVPSITVDGGEWAQGDVVEYQTKGGQGEIISVNTDDNTIVLNDTGDRDNRWIAENKASTDFSVAGPSIIDEPLLTNQVDLRGSDFATTPPGVDTLKEIIWDIDGTEYSAGVTNPWKPLNNLPTNSTVSVKVKYKGNTLEDSAWSPTVTFTTGATIRSLFTRLSALEANDVTDDATDTALLTLIAGLAARIQALEESN